MPTITVPTAVAEDFHQRLHSLLTEIRDHYLPLIGPAIDAGLAGNIDLARQIDADTNRISEAGDDLNPLAEDRMHYGDGVSSMVYGLIPGSTIDMMLCEIDPVRLAKNMRLMADLNYTPEQVAAQLAEDEAERPANLERVAMERLQFA